MRKYTLQTIFFALVISYSIKKIITILIMHKQIQKTSHFPHSKSNSTVNETQKLRLSNEIQKCQAKIRNLKDLEIEVQLLDKALKDQTKSKVQQARNSERILIQEKPRRSSRSTLKVKGYEVQKKLNIKDKEKRQKQSKNLTKLKQHQQILISIDDLEKLVASESNQFRKLQKLKQHTTINRQRLQTKIEEEVEMIKQEEEVIKMYQTQKHTAITTIKQMKRQLNISAEETLPGQDQRDQQSLLDAQNLQIGQYDDNINEGDVEVTKKGYLNQSYVSSQNCELLLSPSTSRFNQGIQDSFHNRQFGCLTPQKTNRNCNTSINRQYFSFGKNIHPGKIQNNKYLKNPQGDKQIFSEQFKFRQSKINDQLVLKLSRIQKNLKQIRKKNAQTQYKLKHKRVTLQLLQKRVERTNTVILNERRYLSSVCKNKKNLQTSNSQKNFAQGQLGRMRGSLGVVVENQKVINLINEELISQLDHAFDLYEQLQISLTKLKGIFFN